jgi:hypothetical protein
MTNNLHLFLHTVINAVGDAEFAVDEPPLEMIGMTLPGGLDPRKEIARAIIRTLGTEFGVTIPGDTICGRCGENACTAPDTIDVDPLCWDCVAEINDIDLDTPPDGV